MFIQINFYKNFTFKKVVIMKVSEDTQKFQFNTHNQRTLGSSPSGTTFKNKALPRCRAFFITLFLEKLLKAIPLLNFQTSQRKG